jgi:hypothetical protein
MSRLSRSLTGLSSRGDDHRARIIETKEYRLHDAKTQARRRWLATSLDETLAASSFRPKCYPFSTGAPPRFDQH